MSSVIEKALDLLPEDVLSRILAKALLQYAEGKTDQDNIDYILILSQCLNKKLLIKTVGLEEFEKRVNEAENIYLQLKQFKKN